MSEMVPRVALPIGRDLIRDIDAEVIRAVQETQAAFRHELRTGLETLKRDMQNIVKDTSTPRRPTQAPVQRTLKSNQPIVQPGGSY
jgi:predicted nuclease with TOPRIM domain